MATFTAMGSLVQLLKVEKKKAIITGGRSLFPPRVALACPTLYETPFPSPWFVMVVGGLEPLTNQHIFPSMILSILV